MVAPPVDPAALDLVWRAAKAGQGPLCVAVSGGGDSLALLALLHERAPRDPIVALIIDHGMQPNSAAVAANAAVRARAIGADAEVIKLFWSGKAPQDHARARAGRYRMLSRAMRRRRARVLALGHTLDDQAETALIKHDRLGVWSHAAGMAAFSPMPAWPYGLGLWAARPLLHTRRAALREWLSDVGLAWRDDPLNDNVRYLRARARTLVSADVIDPQRLATFASRLRHRQFRRNAQAYQALYARARHEEGRAWFDPKPGNLIDGRAFAALHAAIAGATKTAPPAALARALQAKVATLGGVVLRAQCGGVSLTPEPSALIGRIGRVPMTTQVLSPGLPVLVDQRLIVTAHRSGLTVVACKPHGLGVLDHGAPMALSDSADLSICWLTEDHLRHHLAPGDPFMPCGGAEGVQQALGLLS